MVDAVVDFVRKKQPKFVCIVKILIFQPPMLTEFHRSMKKNEGKLVEEKGYLTKIKGVFFYIVIVIIINNNFLLFI